MILYIVGNYSLYNTGKGGHYYSVSQTFRYMSLIRECMLVSVGHEQPAQCRGLVNSYHVFSRAPADNCAKKIREIVGNRRVDLVHCFDYNSSYVAASYARYAHAPFVITKCGGRAPRFYLPSYRNTIVFHEADRKAFENRRYGPDRLELIPNRVSGVSYDSRRANRIFGEKGGYVFFKIGRIGSSYKRSIVQAINLVSSLNGIGFECRLAVIGYVENAEVYASLKDYASRKIPKSVDFYTEDSQTKNAAELLGYSDACISTGRGAVEAMSAGKVVFFPCVDSETPCMLLPETISSAEEENFSERVKLNENERVYTRPEKILSLIKDDQLLEENGRYLRRVFNERYCVKEGSLKLGRFYEVIINDRRKHSPYVKPLARYAHLAYLKLSMIVKLFLSKLRKFAPQNA